MSEHYCKPVPDLPIVPDSLILDLKAIEENQHLCAVANEDMYRSYSANADLRDYLAEFHPYPIVVRYQVINRPLPVHVDSHKADHPWKLNYIIHTGGDVRTQFWSSENEPHELIEEHTLEKNKWYKLNINQPHSITPPITTRISITVKRKT